MFHRPRFYNDVLERLRKSVVRMRLDFADQWMLYHDNAPVTECLTSKGIPVVPQFPYSPGLSPCDLFLFPKL